MSITYTPATNFGAKDSLPTNDPDKVIKGSEFTTEFTAIQTAFGLAAPAASPTFTGTVTISSVDINGGNIDGTTIGGTTPAAGTFSSLTATTADINGGTIDGVTIGGSSAGAITGTTITGTSFVSSGDMTFGDNNKAIFGAGSDLQIYHDGSNSYIAETGTGFLKITSDNYIQLTSTSGERYFQGTLDGPSELFFNNALKLATTATGIDVTGTVTADENITIDTSSSGSGLTIQSSGNTYNRLTFDANRTSSGALIGEILGEWNGNQVASIRVAAGSDTTNKDDGQIYFLTDSDGTGIKNRVNIANNGDISFYEDTGTTPKFFWDASAEALGIGTSPSFDFHAFRSGPLNSVFESDTGNSNIRITSGDGDIAQIFFGDQTNDTISQIKHDNSDNSLAFFTAGSNERMRIDASGNLLVGGTSVTSPSGAAGPLFLLEGANPELIFRDDVGTANNMSMYYINDALVWYSGSAENLRLSNSGNLTVAGALSKGSGSFRIDHPLPAKTSTHHLVHSFVEAPQADNIYRGKVELVDGMAIVNIDTVAGMTEGTFVLLNREVQCFTSNETGWTAVRGKVDGNILTIEAQDPACTDTISWMVVGERQDQHMYDTGWTDENGKVIVEPLKETEGE